MILPPQLIEDLLEAQPRTRAELSRWKRTVSKRYSVSLPTNQTLLDHIRQSALRAPSTASTIEAVAIMERALRIRDVRTLSGVAIITVLVKPYACPGLCVYCPTEVRMPKSYIETEPAAQRALRLNFDPYVQMIKRLEVLDRNGHPTDKIELIIKGGTWSAYPKAYQRWFLKECYRAANEFARRHSEQREESQDPSAKPQDDVVKPSTYADVESLNQGDRTLVETYNKKGDWVTGESTEEEILDVEKINETAAHRIIGLTLETRPDWIDEAEIRQLRILGCTRVELGAQAIDDTILTLIKRGHDVASIARAIALLREAGFKVDVHMMPQLPGTTPQKDVEMFRMLFNDPRFRPDMVKIYPCSVVRGSLLEKLYKKGKYVPYSQKELFDLLLEMKKITPRYVRISRLIRDIPSTDVTAGSNITNLREYLQKKLHNENIRCQCLRCREIAHQLTHFPKQKLSLPILFVDSYKASDGTEYFLSFEDEERKAVYAFCRFRIPSKNSSQTIYLPELKDTALLRELHTYGYLVPIHTETNKEDAPQHTGLGRRLMEKAEEIAKIHGFQKIAVISGIGVREYYRKLGYTLERTYMVKKLC